MFFYVFGVFLTILRSQIKDGPKICKYAKKCANLKNNVQTSKIMCKAAARAAGLGQSGLGKQPGGLLGWLSGSLGGWLVSWVAGASVGWLGV